MTASDVSPQGTGRPAVQQLTEQAARSRPGLQALALSVVVLIAGIAALTQAGMNAGRSASQAWGELPKIKGE